MDQPDFADLTPVSEPRRSSWGVADLVAFASFFVLTLILTSVFLPRDLSAEAQILIQAALDLLWVGFIFFLIKVVHRKPVLKTIHWNRTQRFHIGWLVTLGATLAVTVLIVSSYFPPASAPPIEKLIESSRSLYLLVVFGTLFAPIAEEILFRGFFFAVLTDLGGARLAVPCTAALFALLHAPQLWGSWAGIVLIFVVGYVLSIVRHRSKSLIPSFIVHTAYNSMLFGSFALTSLLTHGTY